MQEHLLHDHDNKDGDGAGNKGVEDDTLPLKK